MIQVDINSERAKKRVFYITLFAVLIIVFYTTNDLIINSGPADNPFTDYPPHINQAMHFKQFIEKDIHQFIDQAPIRHNLIQPVWHISLLPFYYAWRLLDISVDGSARLAASLLIAIYNTLAIAAISVVFQKRLKPEKLVTFAPLLAVVMIFVGPLYIPIVNRIYHLGQFQSGVWHNPTSQPLKFFVIIIFFLIMHLIENRERLQNEIVQASLLKLRKLDIYFVLFSVLLMLSVVYKPSLALVFIPSLFIYCCIDVINTGFKSFWFCFKAGLAVLPSCLLLLVQNTVLADAANTTIIFAPLLVWKIYAPHPLLSALISLPFPIFICIIGFRRLFINKMMFLSLLMLVVSILFFVLLAVYPGVVAMDFIWGVAICTLLIFVTSFIYFVDELTRIGIKQTKGKITAVVGTALIFMQFIFGVVNYFMQTSGKTTMFKGWLS